MHVHTRATKHIGIQIEMNQNGKGGGGEGVKRLHPYSVLWILMQRIHWRKEKQIEGKSYKTCMIVIYD